MNLLEYLLKNEDAALTRAMFVMEKNMRDARVIVQEMQEEGLIVAVWATSGWQKARIRITEKGIRAYHLLKEMHDMLVPLSLQIDVKHPA